MSKLITRTNISKILRSLADEIECSDNPPGDCTIILGTEVYHLGCVDYNKARVAAIFNMTHGLHQLTT